MNVARRRLRPRRSALYIPGSNARALEKARSLPADVLIFDCEDAVNPDKKLIARTNIVNSINAGGYGSRELVVRVNSISSEWGHEDLLSTAFAGADAVLLPKAEQVEYVEGVSAVLAEAARDRPITLPAIWCMIETPLGVLRADNLAGLPQVECLVAGTSDLSADLRCDGLWNQRAALIPSLSRIVLAARAHGKAVLDGVHLDLDDDKGLLAACEQGCRLGFDGKTLIHPKTLSTANTTFAPSDDEVTHARRVIEAHAEAVRFGSALVVLDGKLIEELHVRAALRLVELHELIRQH
mmetsp:Transcript_8632/g.14538  ORF Transcript_8632/g.14538 Transcript_8632/m.14538 type:complete len:296 (+) Transcript_8632:90-977(+)